MKIEKGSWKKDRLTSDKGKDENAKMECESVWVEKGENLLEDSHNKMKWINTKDYLPGEWLHYTLPLLKKNVSSSKLSSVSYDKSANWKLSTGKTKLTFFFSSRASHRTHCPSSQETFIIAWTHRPNSLNGDITTRTHCPPKDLYNYPPKGLYYHKNSLSKNKNLLYDLCLCWAPSIIFGSHNGCVNLPPWLVFNIWLTNKLKETHYVLTWPWINVKHSIII